MLLTMAVIKLNPHAPATMSGMMHAGTYTGGVVGPLAFGVIVEGMSFTSAWTAGAIALGLSSAFPLALHFISRSPAD
jgi:predicted MFS family arabinose efflux permease